MYKLISDIVGNDAYIMANERVLWSVLSLVIYIMPKRAVIEWHCRFRSTFHKREAAYRRFFLISV